MTKNFTLTDLMAVTDEMLEELFADPDFPAMPDGYDDSPSEQSVRFLLQYAGSFDLATSVVAGRLTMFTN
jgi:hypothetical protein